MNGMDHNVQPRGFQLRAKGVAKAAEARLMNGK